MTQNWLMHQYIKRSGTTENKPVVNQQVKRYNKGKTISDSDPKIILVMYDEDQRFCRR